MGAMCFGPSRANATEILHVNNPLCHAVSAIIADNSVPPSTFTCTGEPEGYQHGTLWLRKTFTADTKISDDLALVLRNSRFDRLVVTFSYADGASKQQEVRVHDYGTHWRAGGLLAFQMPKRDVRPVAITLQFDKLAGSRFLRMRLEENGEENKNTTALAASIGAALVLLLVAAIYNASLALGIRKSFLAWHAAWATCMIVWGICWSQFNLFFFPTMAGAISAQICTALSCLAIMLATLSGITTLEKHHFSTWLRRFTLFMTGSVFVLGVLISLMRSGPIYTLGNILNILILGNLLAVTCCIIQAWKRGSNEARNLAGAWVIPIIILASTKFFDADAMFWGSGSLLLVLIASAWQTIWFSFAATRAQSRLRVERDMALRSEAQAQKLARRDALTGLPNRRGFIESTPRLLNTVHDNGGAAALLLIDVDWFKAINDDFGHDAGDVVLESIASCIAPYESPYCTVARLGGEEFAVLASGVKGLELIRFAETMRQKIRDFEHGELIKHRKVTVSIGIAETTTTCDFHALYRLADEALYEAKRGGRNKVAIRLLDPVEYKNSKLKHIPEKSS